LMHYIIQHLHDIIHDIVHASRTCVTSYSTCRDIVHVIHDIVHNTALA
jgi:hypothetical protein